MKVGGERLQKRYLNDTLSALYKTFISVCPLVVSFATFCKYRPKHVVQPKVGSWDTCLCAKCQNFKLLMRCLKSAKVIDAKNREEVFSSLCCDSNSESCLFRSCDKCKINGLKFNIHNGNMKISYQQWVTKKVPHRTEANRTQSITRKETKECTISQCVKLFKDMLPANMSHVGRIVHQREQWKLL